MQEQQMRIWLSRTVFIFFIVFSGSYMNGCSPTLSTSEELEKFNQASPINPEKNLGYPIGVKNYVGPYRVMPGDVLEFQMPAVLRVISSDLPEWLRPTYGRSEAEP